tara:strand:- start:4329 stop:7178 length:2850 start_codon:yes stop_codon:yes gene_type:complete
MKAIILFIFFTILTVSTVFGQIKIGDNPQNIDPTSVLELESTSKVLVITRVSTLEMEAITPQRGGMVYNTDTECINYYDGTQWINLCDAVNFTITNDPIINGRSTIEITESAGGYNLEVAKNSILGDNIIDGGIGPDDIQDNSITQDKLAAESVGSSELRQNSVGTEEIRDGSIAPADIANFLPGQVLTTDENGIVQWQDSNELYDLTFNKLDNTLTISRSTTAGVSTIDLAALVGSDDQILTLTDNTLSLENDPNDIDLSTYLQQLSINAAGDEISLTNGGTITLPNPTIDTDEQNLGTTTLANEILTITIENGDPTTADLTPFATDAVVTAGLALKENIANKSNDVTLGNSTDLYPTQNAVKTYVDNTVGGSAQTIVSTDPNNSITQSVNDGGAFYNDDDGDSQNELQDLNFNPVTNILTISTPLTTGNEVNLSALAGGGALNDGQIFVGNNLNTPTGVDVGGDLTMNNIGQFSIVNNVIDNDNIINNSITLEDLNQNGATNGQVIKWDETLNAGLGAWAVANDNTGGTGSTVTSDDNTISGDGVNTSLQIKDDGVTSTQIADGTISATDLALGAVGTDNILDGTISSIDIANKNITLEKMADGTAAGQLLQWDGTNWVYITEADITATVTEVDGIIGNEVSVAADATLVLSGAGTNADPLALDVAPLGIDTAELAAEAVTPAKIEPSITTGQILATNGANVEWQDLTNPANTGSILFSDGTGGITENNAQLFWNNTALNLRLGIGTANPDSKLHVLGQIRASTIANGDGTEGLPAYRFQDDLNSGMWLPAESELAFSTDGTEAMRIDPTQNIIINENLQVGGNVTVTGTHTPVPDYVFQKYFLGNSTLNPNYEFNDLAEIEAFVKENNHLPGIQSAQAVKEQGFWNVSESSRVNLEKIEELFLHTIEQEKKIKELKAANTNMQTEMEALKAQMEEIKSMLLEKENN